MLFSSFSQISIFYLSCVQNRVKTKDQNTTTTMIDQATLSILGHIDVEKKLWRMKKQVLIPIIIELFGHIQQGQNPFKLLSNEEEDFCDAKKNTSDSQETTNSQGTSAGLSSQLPTASQLCARSEKEQAMKESKGPPCPDHLRGQCAHGFKGLNCELFHQKVCSKFLRNGRFRGGCTKGKECKSLHIRLCKDSFNKRMCLDQNCKMKHLQRTRREQQSTIQRSAVIPPWSSQQQHDQQPPPLNQRQLSINATNQLQNQQGFLDLKTILGQMQQMMASVQERLQQL